MAITIGLLLAVSNAWAMIKAIKVIAASLQRYSESQREWCLGALYVAATLWIPFAAFLGHWVTSVAIR